MRLIAIFVAAGMFTAITAGPSAAQTYTAPANPVSDAVRNQLKTHAAYLIAAAERFPQEKYDYRPTPAQMTFGQLVAHVAQTNMAIGARRRPSRRLQ
jgi:hypothetical protein